MSDIPTAIAAPYDAGQIFSERQSFSKAKVLDIASDIGDLGKHCCVAVTGSYGRLEAGPHSDFDYFIVKAKEDTNVDDLERSLRKAVLEKVGKLPSEGGPFAKPASAEAMIRVIGGKDESNDDLTRRILLLIEGRCVLGQEYFDNLRSEILSRYITDKIKSHQLGLFLLNDLIRYYRTMCVDFEYKTAEQGKSWGDRNIKLVFSRKLIYFAGILVSAEMAQRTHTEKMEIAQYLLSLTPIDRIQTVCDGAAERALSYYANFIHSMLDDSVREGLKVITSDRATHTEEFQRMKNNGHHFTWHLLSALQSTYHSTHPIHKSLIL